MFSQIYFADKLPFQLLPILQNFSGKLLRLEIGKQNFQENGMENLSKTSEKTEQVTQKLHIQRSERGINK